MFNQKVKHMRFKLNNNKIMMKMKVQKQLKNKMMNNKHFKLQMNN